MCLNNVILAEDREDIVNNISTPIRDIINCEYLNLEEYNQIIDKTDLVIKQLNIRGLVNKQHDLNELLNKLNHKVHMIILSETWLNDVNKKLIYQVTS